MRAGPGEPSLDFGGLKDNRALDTDDVIARLLNGPGST